MQNALLKNCFAVRLPFSPITYSAAPNEELITVIGDGDDDDLEREVNVSHIDEDEGGGDGGAGEVAAQDALVAELKEELRRMDELHESLVREVVLRGR